jgi:hypothetical protein
MMQHLDDGLLHELVDGEVPSDQLVAIQRHLEGCAACRARLEEARALATGADDLIEALDVPDVAARTATPVLPLPVHRPAPRWGRALGLAASLTVAAGLGYAVHDLLPPPSDDRAIATSAAPGATEPAPANTAAATDQPAREASPPGSTPVPAAPTAAKPTAEPAAPPAAIATRDRAEARPPDLADAGIEPRVEVTPPIASEVARAAAPAPRTGRAPLGIREQVEARDLVVVPRENSLIPRDAAPATAKLATLPLAVEFGEAMAILGGRLRLVDGLVPSRMERVGDEVQVIYPVTEGVLVLSQQRVGEELRWRLTGPPGFPADSLEVLRRRVER